VRYSRSFLSFPFLSFHFLPLALRPASPSPSLRPVPLCVYAKWCPVPSRVVSRCARQERPGRRACAMCAPCTALVFRTASEFAGNPAAWLDLEVLGARARGSMCAARDVLGYLNLRRRAMVSSRVRCWRYDPVERMHTHKRGVPCRRRSTSFL
jgi:hypothetical protein